MRFIGLMLIAAAMLGCTRENGEITVYPIQCTESIQNDICNGDWVSLNTTTYRVSAERQFIIYWAFFDIPSKLTECVVRDVKNWKGSYPDGSGSLQMEDGQFSKQINYPDPEFKNPIEEQIRYVSWYRYWKIRLVNMFLK